MADKTNHNLIQLPSSLTDIQIYRTIMQYWHMGRNTDSDFTASSCIVVRKGSRRYMMFGTNNEIPLGYKSNQCAESTILALLSALGHDMVPERILIMGEKKNAQPTLMEAYKKFQAFQKRKNSIHSAELQLTPPCPHCLIRLSQYSDGNTKVVQVPFFTEESQIQAAMELSEVNPLISYIPPIFRYNTVKAHAFQEKQTKPEGIYSTDPVELKENIRKVADKLFGEDYYKDVAREMQRYGKVTEEVEHLLRVNAGGRDKVLGVYLSLVRNVHYLRMGMKPTRVEASLTVFEATNPETTERETKYIISVGHNYGKSRLQSSYLDAISNIRKFYEGAQVKHIFLMGDSLWEGADRMYILFDDLYDINKISSKALQPSGQVAPNAEIIMYPVKGSPKFTVDKRPLAEQLTGNPSEHAILCTTCAQLQPAAIFHSPRHHPGR